MPEHIYDKGYRRLLSKKKNFLSLLKSFINETWVKELTEDNIKLVNSKFILKDFKEKESDLIYEVSTEGKKVIFYFLFELQSTVDYTMCFRLFVYIFELYRRIFLDTDENERISADFKLPVIIPCVLYNGSNNWTAVKNFKEYLEGYEFFGDYVIDFKYILINVNKYSDEVLLEIGNLISSIFMLDKKQDIDTLKNSMMKINKIFITLSNDEQIELIYWLRDVLRKKIEVNNTDFIEIIIENFRKGAVTDMTYAIERLFDEERAKARSEGEIKGESKLISQIRKKMDKSLNPYQIADNLELDTDYVQRVVRLINENQSLSDKDIAIKIIQQV